MENKDRIRYYFISDLHFGHKNILKFQPERCGIMGIDPGDPDAIDKHDRWIVDMWRNTVRRQDYVYILGDFSFRDPVETRRILEKLPGNKIMVWGNHDKSSKANADMFKGCSDIKETIFKTKNDTLGFLEENLRVEMCHYPIMAWNNRQHGSIHLHGHVHGSMDGFNRDSGELRVDVGLDGELSGGRLIEIEDIYRHFKEVSGGMPFEKYVKKLDEEKGYRL